METSIVEKQAALFSVLADPTRLKLLRLLAQQQEPNALCVNALAYQLGVTQSAVSQHLRVLKSAGLVKGERRGYRIHYFINKDGLKSCLELATAVLDVDNVVQAGNEATDVASETPQQKGDLRRYHEDASGIKPESLRRDRCNLECP